MFLAAAYRDQRRWIGRAITTSADAPSASSALTAASTYALARLEGERVLSVLAREVAAIEIAGPIRRCYIARTGQLAGDRAP